MLTWKNASWICLNQMTLFLLLVPALCDLALMCVKLEPLATWVKTFNFDESMYTNFYNCLVTRYDHCLIKYESFMLNVTQIEKSGPSNFSTLTVYTCKNNQSANSILCSREDQCNYTIDSYDFAFVWNNSAEYFYHPYLNNKTITCENRHYSFYFSKSDESTITQLNPQNTMSTILKSTFSTTTNNTTSFNSEDNKLPLVLGIIGGIACLALIIAATVFIIRRVQKNQTLLGLSPTDSNSLTNRNLTVDRVTNSYNNGNQCSIKPNDQVTVSPNVCAQSYNDTDSLDQGFKYFNTIVEDDYTCIDDNKRNSHVISTAAVSARIHPESNDLIDSLKTDYTDIKITKENNDLISTNKTETRKVIQDDGFNLISDTKGDYSRLGQDIRNVNNPYDGLLELKEEQLSVPQHELSPYTLAKPIPGAATLEVIEVSVCNNNLQLQTAASKHSVNTEYNYDTPPNTDIKRNVFGYTEVKKHFLK